MASSFSCSSSGGRYVANAPVALVASPVATASSFSVTATAAAAVKQHLKYTHTKQQHSNKSSTPPSEPSQFKPASRICCSSGGGCSGCCSWRFIAPPPASTPTITTTSTTTTASPPSSPSPSFGVCHRWLKAKGGHTGCGEQD